MKLRVKGDSLRLRLSPSEVQWLLNIGRVEDTIHFGAAADAKLTYALEHAPDVDGISIRYMSGEVTVVVSSHSARAWADSPNVGIYGSAGAGAVQLELAVEKDFACLDKSEAENVDTFPHPAKDAHC